MPAAEMRRSAADSTSASNLTMRCRRWPCPPNNLDDLLALDEALAQLAVEAPAKAELVKLRYFAGLSLEEAADAHENFSRHRQTLLGLRPGVALQASCRARMTNRKDNFLPTD